MKTFFGTINFGRVRGFFLADRDFSLNEKIATLVAQIACHENRLPQGSPCSPVISNLIGHILDVRLARLAKRHGCRYTRYADDITISTTARTFPRALATRQKAQRNKWNVNRALREEIKGAGFRINSEKTRMQIQGSHQSVTGLVVNQKVNVSQKYYRQVRSMCHELFRTGEYYIDNGGDSTKVDGIDKLAGMLSHVFHVKGRLDRSDRENKIIGHDPPPAVTELYRRFLFYRYFLASDKPMIVTEGGSDIVYIKCAIRSLADNYPLLAESKNGATTIKPAFLKPSRNKQSILKLGTGTGGMTELIKTYRRRSSKYGVRPMLMPVVLLVDNDKGAENVFG